MEQVIKLERFGDEVARATFYRSHSILDGAVASDDDGDDFWIQLARCFDDRCAVHAWESEVGDDDVEREISQPLPRCLAAVGLHHPIAVLG